jgi:hypothetical protein
LGNFGTKKFVTGKSLQMPNRLPPSQILSAHWPSNAGHLDPTGYVFPATFDRCLIRLMRGCDFIFMKTNSIFLIRLSALNQNTVIPENEGFFNKSYMRKSKLTLEQK